MSLKDLVEERKSRLEQQYWLYQLNREVDELEQWIAQKEVVASSPELGQDFEHVTVSVSTGDCLSENEFESRNDFSLFYLLCTGPIRIGILAKCIRKILEVHPQTTLEPSLLQVFYFFPALLMLQVLQDKFTKFATETGSVGQERVTAVNQMVDELIDYGHSEAATIAEWKDGVNEAWADLLELMETRSQMLAASHQLHKFFSDCREVQ